MLVNNYDGSCRISFFMDWFNTTVRSGNFNNLVVTACLILISVSSVDICLIILPLINFVSQAMTIDPSMNSVHKSISPVFFQNLVMFSIFDPFSDFDDSFRNLTVWCCIFRACTISSTSFTTRTWTISILRFWNWDSWTATLLIAIIGGTFSWFWLTTSALTWNASSITFSIGISKFTVLDRRFDSEWATGIITTGSAAWVSADGPGKKDNSEDFLDTHLISMIGIFQPRIYDSLWLDFTLHSKSKMI